MKKKNLPVCQEGTGRLQDRPSAEISIMFKIAVSCMKDILYLSGKESEKLEDGMVRYPVSIVVRLLSSFPFPFFFFVLFLFVFRKILVSLPCCYRSSIP